ncbi:hypothetical protein AB2N04_10610 [Nitratireductor sp. GISD-1A_MAKvit]|uniref:hypothetical protein n=1 Tax=Nitratireductor sp. GISD-1A_MAKvit TaxID=3234198 RepID=UPI003466223B
MADHSSNHRADNSVVPDDDPFAELTRIMGHDPRQGDNSAAEIDQGGDDLALELENELLGDLADFTQEGVDASARAGEQQLHQSNDWRFEPVPDGAPATKDEFEPSVDLTADMTDELDKEFGGGLRFEPATEEAGVPEPLALGSNRSSAPDYRTDGDAGTDIQPEAPVDDAVFEFSEQDFALLDADLDASISGEDTEIPNERRGYGDEPVSGPAMPMAVPEPEGDAAFPSSDMNADGMARDEDAHEPSPASADPFLSPQAFASSVANGGSGPERR